MVASQMTMAVNRTRSRIWKQHVLAHASCLFGGTKPKPDELDLKSLHDMIRQLMVENKFSE